MNNANLYQQSNSIQKRDALACLEKHAPKMKWKNNNNRIIDIGCGDGTVTNMLKKYIPTDFKLLGSDTSESMVDYANKHHCNEQTSFTVLDIAGDLPEGMKGNFDHVFSFYVLHWVIDQKRAFKNIFDLLDQDGECFMIFLACNPIYDIYRILSRKNKWCAWLKDVEKYISPYHDSEEPDKEIMKMMAEIGFVDIDVECKDMIFMYNDMDTIRKAVTAVNPFKIPKDEYDEFLEDYIDVLKNIELIDKVNNNDSSEDVKFNYKLLVVYEICNQLLRSDLAKMSRHGDCKVYVGDLGNNASKPELEDAFSYYGPLRNVWIARNPPGFAFVEFEDPRDAEDATRGLDGRTICGRRARVEMSNGGRGYGGRGPPPRSRVPPRPYDDRCYDCGDRGHYARDCTRRRRRRLSLACAPRTNSSVSALLIVCAT
ncbi:unnamed protein product [Arctia plantaginis]|uniref:Uncharacterized protein n=1 Tax=Arctia plantaginis TaxID=874455 RepID=A0A8S0YWB1_ARCPL|nr:unnamed protein product [Arctia plantaginis]CAB3247929.1 unnamed protein product [Arctia plantaginis]